MIARFIVSQSFMICLQPGTSVRFVNDTVLLSTYTLYIAKRNNDNVAFK